MLKHDVTRMSEVLSHVQPYIQLDEAMKRYASQSLKRGDDREKSKSRYESNQGHQPELEATLLQKMGVPGPFTKSTPSLQEGRALHSAETPHQKKHLQVSIYEKKSYPFEDPSIGEEKTKRLRKGKARVREDVSILNTFSFLLLVTPRQPK